MEQAWIAGKPASLDAAIAEAARLLHASRHALICGLGADVAAARAAVALAQRIGAVIDHMHSDAVLRDLDVMRSSGVMLTTPTEAHARADTLLLAGTDLTSAWPDLPQRLLGKRKQSPDEAAVARRIFWLCPGADATAVAGASTTTIGKKPDDLSTLVAALRARVAGRPIGKAPVALKVLDEVASALQAARFGVAIWSAGTLDALGIEMMSGLVGDLNATTRFSALPLAAANNAWGVLQTCGWMTGLPMRTGFGRGVAEHDPWLFDAGRLVDSGETDCVLWVSAYRALAPAWRKAPHTIALTGRDAKFAIAPRVHIAVGRPGVDHPAVEHSLATGTLAAVDAAQASERISAADAMTRMADALPMRGGEPC